MANKTIAVEVAYAKTDQQMVIPLTLDDDTSLEDAIKLSGILKHFPEIDLTRHKVGVFGKTAKLEQKLADGDRVEIYRPLLQHPMEARRNRALAK